MAALTKGLSDTLYLSDNGASYGHEQSLHDYVAFADSQVHPVAKFKSLADSVSFADAFAREAEYFRTAADTIDLKDGDDYVWIDRDKELADTIALADSPTNSIAHPLALSDTIGFSDLQTHPLAKFKTLSDVIAFSDSIARASAKSKTLSDSIAFSDSQTHPLAVKLSLSDSIGFSDSQTHPLAKFKPLSDSVAFSDSEAKVSEKKKSLSDSIAFSDLQVHPLAVKLSLSDTVAFSDTQTHPIAKFKALADSVAFTEVFTRGVEYKRSPNDNVAFTDAKYIQALNFYTLELADTIDLRDGDDYTWIDRDKYLEDSIALSDANINCVPHFLELSDTVAFSDSESHPLAKTKTLADTVAFSDGQSRDLHLTLGDSIAFTDDVTDSSTIKLDLSDTINFTDAASLYDAGEMRLIVVSSTEYWHIPSANIIVPACNLFADLFNSTLPNGAVRTLVVDGIIYTSIIFNHRARFYFGENLNFNAGPNAVHTLGVAGLFNETFRVWSGVSRINGQLPAVLFLAENSFSLMPDGTKSFCMESNEGVFSDADTTAITRTLTLGDFATVWIGEPEIIPSTAKQIRLLPICSDDVCVDFLLQNGESRRWYLKINKKTSNFKELIKYKTTTIFANHNEATIEISDGENEEVTVLSIANLKKSELDEISQLAVTRYASINGVRSEIIRKSSVVSGNAAGGSFSIDIKTQIF